MTRVLLIVAGVAALGLVGCGKVGTLDQPAPLYGDKAKADYQARRSAADQAAQDKKDQAEIETLPPDTDRKYDPNLDPGPARALPVPGAPPSPNGPPPPGVLPDPFNHPQ